MKMSRLLAATALLIPSVPNTPATAQSPRWGDTICTVSGDGVLTCYAETRGECQYARAKEALTFRPLGLTIEQCRPSDDPFGLGAEWEFSIDLILG